MVRCKFKCTHVTKRASDGERLFTYTAHFNVVYSDSPENKAFFAATPNGSLEVGTYKDDHFQPGKCYFIDISPAE